MATEPLSAQLERLADLRRDFVAKRHAMNAARPDTARATRAEYALYDERYRADHDAERAFQTAAIQFGQWIGDAPEAAQIIAALKAKEAQGGE